MRTVYISVEMLGDAEETTNIKRFCEILGESTGCIVKISPMAHQINAAQDILDLDGVLPESAWNMALDAAQA